LKYSSLFILWLLFSVSFSQGVTVGSANPPDPSAVLDVQSSQQGFLLPRLTTVQRNAVLNPALGLQIYNLSTECLEMYFSTGWKSISCSCTQPPPSPGNVSGYTAVCPLQLGVSYSINPVAGAVSYVWSVPQGASIVSGQGTDSIVVNMGTTSGNVSVYAVNGCGSSSVVQIQVMVGLPASTFTYSPSSISIGVPISFTPTASGLSYAWTFQSGTPSTSSLFQPSVTWSQTGTVTAKLVSIANPFCMDSSLQTITVINCPSGSSSFSFTGGLQTFTVPACVSSVTITANGASGGNAVSEGSRTGGLGARITGTFQVTGGQTLTVLVGGAGANGGCGGGGGGGSFIVSGGQLLLAAGGGGGAMICNYNPTAGGNGGAGQSGNNGGNGQQGDCYNNNVSPSVGGANGMGGNLGTDGYGGGGGGYLGAGQSGSSGGGGAYPGNGASGGASGGYGGGGAGYFSCCGAGGGGGGYSGGAGGNHCGPGGGGGSYNTGSNPINLSGMNSGNGSITIAW